MDNEPESFRNAVRALNKPQKDVLDKALSKILDQWDDMETNGADAFAYKLDSFYVWAREELAEVYWDMFEQRFLNGEKGYRTPGGYDTTSKVSEPDVPYVDNHLGEPKRIPFYRTILLAIRALADKALEEGDKHE